MFCALARATVEDGRLAYEAEDYAKAVNIFEQAARAGDSQGQFYLGDCYFKLGRKKEAIYQWERALKYEDDKIVIKRISQKILEND